MKIFVRIGLIYRFAGSRMSDQSHCELIHLWCDICRYGDSLQIRRKFWKVPLFWMATTARRITVKSRNALTIACSSTTRAESNTNGRAAAPRRQLRAGPAPAPNTAADTTPHTPLPSFLTRSFPVFHLLFYKFILHIKKNASFWGMLNLFWVWN